MPPPSDEPSGQAMSKAARAALSPDVAAARLEALRELAYGAGHEINNPLANIAARAQALLVDEVDPERRRKLATIVDQAFRARDMIGGLMIFARPPRPERERVAVERLVRRALDAVAAPAAARDVRLEYRGAPRPLDVDFDPAHGVEVLRLLLINAIEAVRTGGRVTVASALEAGVSPARVRLTIDDDGHGLPPDALRKAFDPFFSGREAGRGIGMGLPKVWRLLEVGGGSVTVDAHPGPGTTVNVFLPAAEA